MINKVRSRSWFMLFWSDNYIHLQALEYIKLNYSDIAYIEHSKDIYEKKDKNFGAMKKPHTHLVIRFDNARWNTAIAKEIALAIGIENEKEFLQWIQPIKNLNLALSYLIHYKDSSKYQYDINDVKGVLKKNLIRYITADDKNENEKITEIIEFIITYDNYLSLTELSMFISDMGYWDVFRRSGYILVRVLEEHNHLVKGVRK